MSQSTRRSRHSVTNDTTVAELNELPISELNSFFLDFFRSRIKSLTPAQILEHYRSNRFVCPSDIDPIALRTTELRWLELSRAKKFQPLVLSPLAPLGTCSVMGFVDQNNVISALRGTEVVSDATNVLALQLAKDFKSNSDSNFIQKYTAVHRHVRGQATDNPKFSAHFSTFCLASGGYDQGNYSFELNELHEHLSIIYDILRHYFSEAQLDLRFYIKKDSDRFREKFLESKDNIWSETPYEIIDDPDHAYYKQIQFKVFVQKGGNEYNLADGGFVDWTQKLLSNKKHRCMISGIGIELFHRI